MNLKKLFKLQKKLDAKIIKQNNLSDTTFTSQKLLALHVELGELANKTNCFKYWNDNKDMSSKNILLEKYINCLNFLLSIGIDKDFCDIQLNRKYPDYSLIDNFNNIFIDINDFVITGAQDNYITLLEDFLSLGISLEFSDEEIENTYIEKTTILSTNVKLTH